MDEDSTFNIRENNPPIIESQVAKHSVSVMAVDNPSFKISLGSNVHYKIKEETKRRSG
jgi:hypothetical protein